MAMIVKQHLIKNKMLLKKETYSNTGSLIIEQNSNITLWM